MDFRGEDAWGRTLRELTCRCCVGRTCEELRRRLDRLGFPCSLVGLRHGAFFRLLGVSIPVTVDIVFLSDTGRE